MKGPTEKLNIAIVCDPIADYIAGSFVSTLRFAECLSRRGHKIVFIGAKSPYSPQSGFYNGKMAYRFRSFLMPKSEGRLFIALPTFREIKKIFQEEKIDIVHAMLVTPATVVSERVARRLRIPCVMHLHTQPENLFLHIPRIAGRALFSRIFSAYLMWLYRRADAIVYPSEFARRMFPALNINIPHVVVSNGVDTSVFKKVDSEKFFDKYNLSYTAKNILFVGRLHPEKSIETLIRAIPYIRREQLNAHVIIVGAGHLDVKLKRLARNLGLDNYITFCGKVSDEELVMAYNACDVFVLPSLVELEGMVVLEAMACGKPIIIANAKDSASVYFVDQNGLLFKPEDPADLAKQALTILCDDSLRERMGEASLKKSKEYDINRSVSRLEELYYSLLSKKL